MESFRPDYVEALCREIQIVAQQIEQSLPVHTVFFGGGTPSLLQIDEVRGILGTIHSNYSIQTGAEITLEANPGTLSKEYLLGLRQSGVNRLSMGMQSAHPDDLRLLERQHRYPEVIQSVTWARQAGFDNLNLDLMFGLPGQSLVRWQESMELALGLHPEHLSLYALTLEHGTPFQHWTEHGLIQEADPDLAADMYDWAEQRLEQEGFVHYEISNWARGDASKGYLASRHNLQYWRNLPYLGFGAGAHGYAGGYRTANVRGIPQYIKRMRSQVPQQFPISPATVSVTPIDRRMEMEETMMVGLRLTEEGVWGANFEARFGQTLEDVYQKQIARLSKDGLLEWCGDSLRLTQRGHLLGNRVFLEFIGG